MWKARRVSSENGIAIRIVSSSRDIPGSTRSPAKKVAKKLGHRQALPRMSVYG